MASTKKPGRSWVYDLILIDKDDKSRKFCTLCPEGSKPIKCGAKKCNTTNLSKHLLKHHFAEAIEVKIKYSEQSTIIKQMLAKKTKFPLGDPLAAPFNEALTQHIMGEISLTTDVWTSV